jgi:ribonuclease P protein component
MIPKANRINRENFEKVMKKGGFLNSSLFSLRFLKNPEKTTHLSVVVAKKVAKTAVLRNKVRRRGYSILRKLLKESKNPLAGQAYFIILFAKKGAEVSTFLDTSADIQKLLEKAKIV